MPTRDEKKRKDQKNRTAYHRKLSTLASKAAGIGSFEWRIQEGLIEATPELEKLWGLPSGASRTDPDFWLARVAPEDRTKLETAFAEWTLHHIQECSLDFRIVTPNSGDRWLYLRGTLQYNAWGQPERLIGINVDITARKQTEEALCRSEFWLRAIVENVPEVLYLYEPARGVTFWNRQVEDLTGVPIQSLCGEGFVEVFHPDDRPKTMDMIKKAVATGEPYARRHRVRVADGSYRWFYGRAVPVKIDGSTKWFGITSDIDEHVQLEESLKQVAQHLRVTNERLSQSNLDLQDFAMTLAHDLYTPLSTMTTVIYSLCEEYSQILDSQARDYLGFLTKSAEQMRALVDTVWTCPHFWRKKVKTQNSSNGDFGPWDYRAESPRKSLRLPRCGS
jgi:PAS domain S-box-containing protein